MANGNGARPPGELVSRELEKMLSSAAFAGSDRARKFLEFITRSSLGGDTAGLKEYSIGVQVIGRPPSFDPRLDPIVRVEAGRLRSRIAEYYETEGQTDPVIIELPKGTYVPEFRIREVASPPSQPQPHSPARRNPWPIALAILAIPLAAAASYFAASRHNVPTLPHFEQLTFRRGFISSARFSPDGRTALYSAAFNGGPMLLYSTLPGEHESRQMSESDTRLLAVSSSGELAFALRDRLMSMGAYFGVLARGSLAGASAPHEIEPNIWEADWHPGGDQVVVARHTPEAELLEYPAGHEIYRRPLGLIRSPRISRDGRWIAFIERPSDESADTHGSLSVIATTGGKPRKVTPDYAHIAGLAWSAKTSEIWFTAAAHGYLTTLFGVRPDGTALREIWHGPQQLELDDISSTGSVLMTKQSPEGSIAGKLNGDEAEHDLSWMDGSFIHDLTPDGKVLLFEESGEGGTASGSVFLRRAGNSRPERLGDGFPIAISPDGKWVVATSRVKAPPNLILMAASMGTVRPIPTGKIRFVESGHFLADNRTVLLFGNEPDHQLRSYLVDTSTGATRPVTAENTFAVLPTPNGKNVLVTVGAAPGLYPTDGGKIKPLRKPDAGMVTLGWSDRPDTIYMRSGRARADVYRWNYTTGAKEHWGTIQAADPAGVFAISGIRITPDGRYYAYGIERTLSQLFLADGLK